MKKKSIKAICFISAFCILHSAFAETTNFVAAPLTAPALPDASISFIRVLGALALVIGIFLGGVWFFKNWQRLAVHRGRAPKLNVLETRSLGGRHAIYVVGYNQERFLISSSPGGVNFLSHLPNAGETEPDADAKNSPAPSFAQALTQVLKGK
ncbi:MAG TPA: flagellar biosynthetic protein FliO [Verrucomicrobiae bacterium]